MTGSDDATLLVLSATEASAAEVTALNAAANALGHRCGCSFMSLAALPHIEGVSDSLGYAVHSADPWSVVALDEESTAALREAFSGEASALRPDAPVDVRGYRLVAVPGFAEALEDQALKRVAWQRLKAAQHPDKPY